MDRRHAYDQTQFDLRTYMPTKPINSVAPFNDHHMESFFGNDLALASKRRVKIDDKFFNIYQL